MAIIDKIIAQAKSNVKHIVLPEGEETRNIQAARKIADAGIAKLTVLGDPEKVKAVAAETNTCLCGIEIVDPKTSEKAASYASALYELRKAKGMTEEEAARKVQDPMFYGVMMVKMGDADGLVSGAIHSTGDMLRPALQIIKCKPGIKTVSSCFMMESPIEEYGVMIFSDCAVIPNPTAEELANIAVAAAESARTLAAQRGMLDELELMEAVERVTPRMFAEITGHEKVMCANVDMYSGFVYRMMGIPEELYTPLFAIARMVGWCAHRIEEIYNPGNKIIRPAYKAIGDSQEFIPMDQRK